MRALVIKGTTWSGNILNEGTIWDLPPDTFRLLKLSGDVTEAVDPEPEPEPATEVTEPTKQFQRKR